MFEGENDTPSRKRIQILLDRDTTQVDLRQEVPASVNQEPPRWLERLIVSLEECDSVNQVFDVDNNWYPCENVINVPITITSARKRPSDYSHGYFAQVAFQTCPFTGAVAFLQVTGSRRVQLESSTAHRCRSEASLNGHFQTADGSRGQFSIGGNAAWFPLQQQRFGKLPVRAILRTEMTRNGQLYRWERL